MWRIDVLQHITVDDVQEIARLSKEAREAQDLLLNKVRVMDKAEDEALISEQTLGTLDSLDVSLNSPPLDELKERLDALSDEARHELMAVMWIGRGDYVADEWDDALTRARAASDTGDVDYLSEKGPLHDYLSKGLFQLKLV
jgi:Protein of unknown function (DUF3775)